ncbi:hypothetical protein [Nitratidesulfovibrio liaohensis]|uniref:hypothetical protein n=1 Tax=Nitratidesulfovibrio liaohensis TaxID=2604158 RepID=UPI0014225637|nr:hypothetical protein [Nitratidesulfovibrio liaohensis]NHZ45993.1 hypothetical protein [Nitratidesulfovibrio liaohensis]
MWKGKLSGVKKVMRSRDERRNSDRIELMSPFICTTCFNGGEGIIGVVRNIGIGGVLVEFQTELGLSEISEGCPCVLTDMMPEGFHALHEVTGRVEWVYRKFVGIALEPELFLDLASVFAFLKRLRISYREMPPAELF